MLAQKENELILGMQRDWITPRNIEIANFIMNISEINTTRYIIYALYLSGDSIQATKAALVAFTGEFMMVIMKIAYKEPRPYWNHPDIVSYRCRDDFEGPSDHLFLIIFLSTYLNLLYLRKYSRSSHHSLSYFLFLITFVLIALTTLSGMLLGS